MICRLGLEYSTQHDKASHNPRRKFEMIKNILAAIGLFVVSQRGYELYREYSELKGEKERRQPATSSSAQE